MKKKKEPNESLVYDLISFMQKWGLWKDTTIISQGTAWIHTYDESFMYKDLSNVKTLTEIQAEDYTSGPISARHGKPEWISFSNPEHICDIAFEGPLFELLNYGKLTVMKNDIKNEASWEKIFTNTELIDNLLSEYFGISDMEDLYAKLSLGIEEMKEKVCDAEGLVWDYSEYEGWSDYSDLLSGDVWGIFVDSSEPQDVDELQELVHRIVDWENINVVRDRFIEKAKEIYRAKIDEPICDSDKLALHVLSKFNEIFKRHNLHYELGFQWTLSCYNLKNKDKPPVEIVFFDGENRN